ncbi:MAG: amino acid ABC transporter, partial [Mesorhizobium sp.]
MTNRTVILAIASAALAGVAAATTAFAEDGPIKIGIPVGLSGANSVVAPSVVQSAELAVAEINEAGGVLGRQLALE